MKHLSLWHRLIILLITILPLTVSAQEWQWGRHGQFYPKETATDPNGNIYVIWGVQDQCNIDGHAITGFGDGDIGLTSFTCNGDYRWTKVIGSTHSDGAWGLGVDSLGGVYVTGVINSNGTSPIHIDTDTTLAATWKTVLLVKYDTTGNYKWVRMPDPENLTNLSNTAVFNLNVTPNGDTRLFCLLHPGSYANGAFTATYPDSMNYYVLKYNKDGNFQQGIHFDINKHINQSGTFWRDMIYDPVMDQYYLSGSIITNSVSFGNIQINGNAFVAAFGNSGNVSWIQETTSTLLSGTYIEKPAIDNQGFLYVTGSIYDNNTFAGHYFSSSLGTDQFPFLVKLNPSNGNSIWGTNASTNASTTGSATSVTNGIVGVAGAYGTRIEWGSFAAENTAAQNQGYNIFLARFNANTGTIIGFDTLASSLNADDFSRVLKSDKQGNFYLGGTFSGTLYVGNSTLYYQGNNPITNDNGFIAKFGSAACGCSTPTASFSFTHSNADYGFTYSGSTPVDSVVWDFGDGQAATGNTATHTYTFTDTSVTACVTAYNDCGSNQSCQQIEIGHLGINEIGGLANVRIYPNPATNTLFLKGLQQNLQYRMYNSLGAEVQEGQLKAPLAAINMAPLAPGWYWLELQNNKGNTERLKVIKQ